MLIKLKEFYYLVVYVWVISMDKKWLIIFKMFLFLEFFDGFDDGFL